MSKYATALDEYRASVANFRKEWWLMWGDFAFGRLDWFAEGAYLKAVDAARDEDRWRRGERFGCRVRAAANPSRRQQTKLTTRALRGGTTPATTKTIIRRELAPPRRLSYLPASHCRQPRICHSNPIGWRHESTNQVPSMCWG